MTPPLVDFKFHFFILAYFILSANLLIFDSIFQKILIFITLK